MSDLMLTPRWKELRPHAKGEAYTKSKHRFNVVPAGRRSGKTERAKRKVALAAMGEPEPNQPPRRYFVAAPVRDQAKRIFWDDMKALIPPWAFASRPSESELRIRLINESHIVVVGMDVPARMEGTPWDGGVLDEYGNMKETAWGANIRPALSDRNGWCDLIGVPEGRNHYYDLYTKALAEIAEHGDASEWGAFTWYSSDVLDAKEIESAKKNLDPLTFQQEYEASFVNFEGRAYYTFDQTLHCRTLHYNDRANLILCFDFNVEPGVCAIVQEQVLPGIYRKDALGLPIVGVPIVGTGVIGEVYIPQNSNTPAVCKKIVEDWGAHKGLIRCYGDATGGARGTAQTQGSDWDLIKEALRKHWGERVLFEVPFANPAERARVNSMNTRLLTGDGNIHMLVDPVKAPNVVKDLDGVRLLKGGSGEIDKKATPKLTHISDALGYYVVREFPVSLGDGMQRIGLSGV